MQLFQFYNLYIDLLDAYKCIRWKLLRSILSALGIALGTSALIAMMSISEGARVAAEKKISRLGADTIRIEPIQNSNNINISTPLGYKDYLVLSNTLSNVTISPYVFSQTRSIRFEGRYLEAQVIEIGPDWLDAEGLSIEVGRRFEQNDFESGSQKCLVGGSLQLPFESAITSMLSWGKIVCQITGVLELKGRFLVEESILAAIDIDNAIVLPLIRYSEPKNGYSGITIKTYLQDLKQIESIAGRVNNALMRHRQVIDFKVIIPSVMLDKAEEEQKTFNVIMGTIAGLSLLVGGIGVMNIMLAHIAEQRKEIGLRMSIGATKARIASLFLVYSSMICLLGTLVGIVFGILSTLFIQVYFNWDIVFSYFSLSVGPSFSLIIGLVFGVYPALRATEVSPSEIINQP